MKERIKKIRKDLDLTQQEFASRIGTSANVLTNYETGRRNPSASVVNNICKTFHINETWLRTGEGEMYVPINMENQLTEWAGKVFKERDESFKKRFVTMLMDLNEDQWTLLEEMATKLADVNNKQKISEEKQEPISIEEAEAAYIKSRSGNVQRKASSASNTTEESVASNQG